MTGVAWRCHVCHRERPDAVIGAAVYDVGPDYGLPRGVMALSLRYCRDRPGCVQAAGTRKTAVNLLRDDRSEVWTLVEREVVKAKSWWRRLRR